MEGKRYRSACRCQYALPKRHALVARVDIGERKILTTTGWTTATSLREGAGWNRGRGDSAPSALDGAR